MTALDQVSWLLLACWLLTVLLFSVIFRLKAGINVTIATSHGGYEAELTIIPTYAVDYLNSSSRICSVSLLHCWTFSVL